MMKKLYSCDLCHEHVAPENLIGLRFKNMHDFELGNAYVTDGSHVCLRCANQFVEKFPKIRVLPVTENERNT